MDSKKVNILLETFNLLAVLLKQIIGQICKKQLLDQCTIFSNIGVFGQYSIVILIGSVSHSPTRRFGDLDV